MTVRVLSGNLKDRIRITSDEQPAFPIGTVIALAYNGTPDGYIKCNGAAIDRTIYSSLFSAIGTTYGTGNGSTTFNVPDCRGVFLRALDESKGYDTSRVLGSYQDQNFASHNHSAPSPQTTKVGGGGGDSRMGYSGGSTGNNSGSETRPKNYSVVYLIKFR